MTKNKILTTLTLTLALVGSILAQPSYVKADQFNVISIGQDLNKTQKEEVLKYFNASQGSYQEVIINNKEEHEELKNIIPDAQIGTKTISCAYVQPTSEGGINVKTTNLTYVTANMIQNALVTAGVVNANVIATAPFAVSGTGALTGVIKSYEKATGKSVNPEKKELANKEMKVTGDIAQDNNIGKDKAAAVVNDVKKEVIKDKETQPQQIAETINNITNNYGVTLDKAQQEDLNKLMQQIGKQDYDYKQMKETLNNIQEQLNQSLANQGELKGLMNNLSVKFDNMGKWFKETFKKANDDNNNIVNKTDNSVLKDNAIVTGSSDKVKEVTDKAKQEGEGFIVWVKKIFSENENKDK